MEEYIQELFTKAQKYAQEEQSYQKIFKVIIAEDKAKEFDREIAFLLKETYEYIVKEYEKTKKTFIDNDEEAVMFLIIGFICLGVRNYNKAISNFVEALRYGINEEKIDKLGRESQPILRVFKSVAKIFSTLKITNAEEKCFLAHVTHFPVAAKLLFDIDESKLRMFHIAYANDGGVKILVQKKQVFQQKPDKVP